MGPAAWSPRGPPFTIDLPLLFTDCHDNSHQRSGSNKFMSKSQNHNLNAMANLK